MASDGIEVPIDGNPAGFRRAMQEVLQSSKSTASGIESAFSPLQNVFSGVQGQLAALGAVLAGGAMFQEGIEETKKLNNEANELARQMGITATQASIMNVALGDAYTNTEDYGSAAQMLTRQIRTNEDAVNAMGLKTRDASGHYRNMQDVMRDAGKVLEEYKEGIDRTAAAQTLFGKGAGDGAAIIRASKVDMAAAEEKARSLGLVIGEENVAAFKQYKEAVNDAGDVMSALKKVIGDAVMPVLTKLAEWFSDIGPAAVIVVKGAVGGLISAFWALEAAAVTVFEVLKLGFSLITTPIIQSISAISKAVNFDFAGAKNDLGRIPRMWSENWTMAFEKIKKNAKDAADKIFNLFANQTDSAKKDGGGKSYTPPPDKIQKEKKEESLMSYYEAALAEEKRLAYERDALRGYTKLQEVAFWREILTGVHYGTADRLSIERKVSALIVDIKRAEAKQIQDLDSDNINSMERFSMVRLEAERTAAQTALELNQITKAKFIAMEERFEQERYNIQRGAMVERQKMMERDPNMNVVEYVHLLRQKLEAEQQHNTKRMQIQGQMAVENMQIWKSLGDRMGNLWDQGTQAMLQGTLTWSSSMRAIGASIVAWFATDVVGKKVKTWLLGEAAQTGATQTGVATRLAIESWAAIKSIGIMAATAIKKIMNAAAETFAGIFSFLSPTMGPWAAAPAAVGAGAVAAVAGSVMSARNGYDIPRGINPMVQLHEQEMVLPKQHANVIRNIAEGGTGSSGASGGISVHVSAMDSKDVMRALKDGGVLHKAIKDLHRSFAR